MRGFEGIDFTDGRVPSNLARMYFPLYIAYFCSALYDIIGGLWIGGMLGESALAAMSASFPIVMLFSSLTMGATNGITILLSKRLGAKDRQGVAATLSNSLLAIGLFAGILTTASIFGIDGLLEAGNIPPEIFDTARSYLFIRILSFPFVGLYLYFEAILRSNGNSWLQMLTIVLSVVLNAIFDPIFIVSMGINGVAWAILLAQFITMSIMLVYLKVKNMICFKGGSLSISHLREIAITSIPTAIQQSISVFSVAYIQALFSSFGVTALAAYGIASKLEIVVLYPALAANLTETTAIGTCSGAHDERYMKRYLKWGALLAVGLNVVLIAAITLFSKTLAGFFGAGAQASLMVRDYFLIIAIGYLLNCVSLSILGEMNGLGRQMASTAIMTGYFIVVRLPLAHFLAATQLGTSGICIAILISYLAAILFTLGYQFFSLNKKIAVPPTQQGDASAVKASESFLLDKNTISDSILPDRR